jgi:hypothetical protein
MTGRFINGTEEKACCKAYSPEFDIVNATPIALLPAVAISLKTRYNRKKDCRKKKIGNLFVFC